jgi:hypothetical protein
MRDDYCYFTCTFQQPKDSPFFDECPFMQKIGRRITLLKSFATNERKMTPLSHLILRRALKNGFLESQKKS